MEAIGGLDHVIILVRDLTSAGLRMQQLGFRPTPHARHSPAMGTANMTVMFGDGTYFELLSVVSETPLAAAFAGRLKEREGLCSIAMKTTDACLAAAQFARAGVADGHATEFARTVDLPGGAREAAFTIARLDPGATPGGSMFVCQHHTPDVVWRPDHLEQPNGVIGLHEVVGSAAELAPLERAYQRLLGPGRVMRTRDGIAIAAGGAWISFLEPLAFSARFGRMPRRPEPHLAALIFRTSGLDRLRRVLDERGTGYGIGASGAVMVGPESAAGTLLAFLAPPRAD